MKKIIFILSFVFLLSCASKKNIVSNKTETNTTQYQEELEYETKNEIITTIDTATSIYEIEYKSEKDTLGNFVPLIYDLVTPTSKKKITISGPGKIKISETKKTIQETKNINLATKENTVLAITEEKKENYNYTKEKEYQFNYWYILYVILIVIAAAFIRKQLKNYFV